VGDPRLDEPRRWGVFWIHHEAEELRVHHRATLAPDEARAVVTARLASGRVPPQQPPLLGIQLPGARPLLERFWGTVRQHAARVYLILFINDRCLVLVLSP
jgi:hypothetical protein